MSVETRTTWGVRLKIKFRGCSVRTLGRRDGALYPSFNPLKDLNHIK